MSRPKTNLFNSLSCCIVRESCTSIPLYSEDHRIGPGGVYLHCNTRSGINESLLFEFRSESYTMGEKSMLKPFWTVERKESTVTLPLSRPTDFPYYPYKTPYSHETSMGL